MLVKLITALICSQFVGGCYFFKKRQPGVKAETFGVVGESLGPKAGSLDQAALDEVYGITTSHPSAAIRPDPDVVVRNLLLEYREQGSVVAREIGRVERYRLLLGGASQDFTIVPQKTYDATSLLAKLKVAEEICQGLVAPTEDQHPGWDSILPYSPTDTASNLAFLAQRFLGLPSDRIEEDVITTTTAILNTALVDGAYEYESYIPVCATLVLDAGFLLL